MKPAAGTTRNSHANVTSTNTPANRSSATIATTSGSFIGGTRSLRVDRREARGTNDGERWR